MTKPPTIRNCHFEFKCPNDYDKLATTLDPNVRYCDQCSQNVYRCGSLRALAEHSQAGHCVSLIVAPCDADNTREGDIVRVTSGLFENYTALIESVDPNQSTAEVVLQIFGRVTPIKMPLDTLEHSKEK